MNRRIALLLVVVGVVAVVSLDRLARGAGEPKSAADAELRQRLTELQYYVTQQAGTEPPFKNEYWDNNAAGIYVDVVSGEPLFSSLDKYDSGTGWPSFTRPLDPNNIVLESDNSLFIERTEVRSKGANSHLGHVFDDGPPPTGKRFCMNSAALRFVPAAKLKDEGFERYAALFAKQDSSDQTGSSDQPERETALLAGGCFWGIEEIIRKLPGVIETTVGYSGGTLASPTYDAVTTGNTGHAESVQVVFDPRRLEYAELLRYFFRLHDPTTVNRQHNDVGTQYRSAIFYLNDAQRRTAEQVKADVAKHWDDPIVTEIVAASPFYAAEEYHQDYLQKHPGGYTCHYLRDW